MRKLGLVQAWFSCCAGVCLIVAACSSQEDDGGRGGSGGTEAVGGSVTGGRASGGAAGGGSGGLGGGSGAGASGGGRGGTGSGGQGGGCDEEVTGRLIQLTLDEYCEIHDCPRTLDQARADVTGCREYQYSEEITGCGYTVVRFLSEEWGRGYVFEGTTLVGAYSYDDIIEPPCDTQGENGGMQPPACPGADSCRLCDREDGSGGAGPFCDFGGGGEGGFGGRGG